MRADDLIAQAITKAAEAQAKRATRVSVTTLPAEYVGRDSEGKSWVLLPGATTPTPVRRMAVEADLGDTVSVTVGNGRAVVDSNISNPSAGVVGVRQVRSVAQGAQITAEGASKDAQAAIGYASSARLAAKDAKNQAESATASAATANEAANRAVADAATANAAAESAVADAATAADRAASAIESAAAAQTSADNAQESALQANSYARGALAGLSEIENVVGALNWIGEHGTYVSASGTPFDPQAVYYTRTGEGTSESPYSYAIVAEPDPDYIDVYYTLSFDASVQQYIAAHVAVTDEGMHVIGNEADYSALLSPSGMEVRDPTGRSVALYGETMRLGLANMLHLLGTSTRLAFHSPSGDVAYFGMGDDGIWRMFIEQADVSDMIRFGNYAWVKRNNGNMTIKYIEG